MLGGSACYSLVIVSFYVSASLFSYFGQTFYCLFLLPTCSFSSHHAQHCVLKNQDLKEK